LPFLSFPDHYNLKTINHIKAKACYFSTCNSIPNSAVRIIDCYIDTLGSATLDEEYSPNS
jgi:hypothetical protein